MISDFLNYDFLNLNSRKLFLCSVYIFVFYLLWGTGFATDDYFHLKNGLTRDFLSNLIPKEYISIPLLHYTHAIWYYLFKKNYYAYDCLKSLYLSLCIYGSFRYFSLYLDTYVSIILAFFFVFYPLHDAATYSFTEIYLVISFCSYLYAYALGSNSNYILAFIFSLAASFSSYGSTPIAIGLTTQALLESRRKLSAVILIPNIIYSAYYIITNMYLGIGTQRVNPALSIPIIIKQYFLQIITFLDGELGLSFAMKMFYSFFDNSTLSFLVGILAVFTLLVVSRLTKENYLPISVALASFVTLLCAFGIFSLTGLYPQVDFNIADRVMIYGSFFVVCLFGCFIKNGNMRLLICATLLFVIVGLSQHWKNWRYEVDRIADNLCSNDDIRNMPFNSTLYVSGHQYSLLGPFSHIDFFSTDYVVDLFSKISCKREKIDYASFNRRLKYEDGFLIDKKFNTKKHIDAGIFIYDSSLNKLNFIPASEINNKINSLPLDLRHWIQLVPDGRVRDIVLQFIPRLNYLF